MKGADQCPRCASRAWIEPGIASPDGFYSADVRVCRNCRTIWEPFDPAQLRDPRHEPLGAFIHPCNNCAFRKGSPEQRDQQEFARLRASLARGAGFYCHKGVPVEPASEHGFAYPEEGKNPRKLRLCRGYLNQLANLRPELFAPAGDDEPWIDEATG